MEAKGSGPAAVPVDDANRLPDGLLLAGGVLGVAMGILGVLFMTIATAFVRVFLERAADAGVPARTATVPWLFPVLGAIIGGLAIAGGFLCLRARKRLRRSRFREGRDLAVTAAVLLLLGATLAGVLALVGALLVKPLPEGP